MASNSRRGPEFSRTTFLKGGGGLVVGFSVLGAGVGVAAARAADSPYASNGPFDLSAVDSFIAIHADNTASIRSGRVELGQGSITGLLQIAGEELGLEMSQLRHVTSDTNVTPSTGSTSNSSSINTAGPRVRAAAAAAKQALFGIAAAQLGVPVLSLSVSRGVVSGGGKSVTYGELLGDKLFNVSMPAASSSVAPGAVGTRPVASYTLVTTRVPRVDIPDKATGAHTHVHNIRVPGMLHGRVVRPRGQAAYGSGAQPLAVDEGSIRSIPGARIVRTGDFVGVVAPTEYAAIQAAAQLRVKWQEPTTPLSGNGNLWASMRAAANAGRTADAVVMNRGDVGQAFASAAKVASGTFMAPHSGHMPIGPSCAIADVTPSGALVMVGTQDVYGSRTTIASVLGLSPNLVRVKYYEGSSCYGTAPYDDAAQAAAVMSQIVGKPVRVQFMRWDEHGWDNFGAAGMFDVRGAIDAKGNLTAFDLIAYIPAEIGSRPGTTTELVSAVAIADPGKGTRTADASNSAAAYVIPNYRLTGKNKLMADGVLKGAPTRQVTQGAIQFASEQIIDELAHAAGMDPLAFRLQNMTDSRWIGPLRAVAQAAGWQPRVAASSLSDADVVTGRGIGFGAHSGGSGAAIAEIEVHKNTGKIVVKHIYASQDQGLTIGPGLVENQIVGSVIQGTSRALYEELRFTKTRVTGLDWVTYPMLRFKESPRVTPIIVQRADLNTNGAGEPVSAAPSPAIANAFFDATGVRIRQLPMTPGVVRATLRAAGVV